MPSRPFALRTLAQNNGFGTQPNALDSLQINNELAASSTSATWAGLYAKADEERVASDVLDARQSRIRELPRRVHDRRERGRLERVRTVHAGVPELGIDDVGRRDAALDLFASELPRPAYSTETRAIVPAAWTLHCFVPLPRRLPVASSVGSFDFKLIGAASDFAHRAEL